MSTPEPPPDAQAPPPSSSASGIPLRSLTAWVLIGIAAVLVVFGFLAWIFPTFAGSGTARFSVHDFADIRVIVAPLLAMLVATKLGRTLGSAKLMGQIALGTYAAAVLFGVVAFFVRIASKFDVGGGDGIHVFGRVLQGLGSLLYEVLALALLVAATLWTYKIATRLGVTLPAVKVQTDDD